MARKTLDEIMATEPQVDRKRLDATTEAEIRRYRIEDGEDLEAPGGDAEFVVPPQVVRDKLGMTQEEFARALRIPIGTLRNWEQKRVGLDPAVRTLLAIVYRRPDVLKALVA